MVENVCLFTRNINIYKNNSAGLISCYSDKPNVSQSFGSFKQLATCFCMDKQENVNRMSMIISIVFPKQI